MFNDSCPLRSEDHRTQNSRWLLSSPGHTGASRSRRSRSVFRGVIDAVDWRSVAGRCVPDCGRLLEIELHRGSEGIKTGLGAHCAASADDAFTPTRYRDVFAFAAAVKSRSIHVYATIDRG
jgi:hypothetical protein